MSISLKSWSLIISLLVASLGSWLFYRELKRVEASTATAWEEDHRADCAVVLTGGAGRVREGFDLLAQKNIKKLIISGVYPQATLREIFPQWVFYGTLDERDVILEKRSKTTYGNAQQTLPLVEALHCRDLILVTSRLHMYRSHRIFSSVFPHDFVIYPRGIVQGSYHHSRGELVVEVIKSLFYSLWAY
ncbi:MAG: YdcF family protein [Bdellovibrionales bacterium]|nr:YdcF family protein [Bdellovibrionales bacterium]